MGRALLVPAAFQPSSMAFQKKIPQEFASSTPGSKALQYLGWEISKFEISLMSPIFTGSHRYITLPLLRQETKDVKAKWGLCRALGGGLCENNLRVFDVSTKFRKAKILTEKKMEKKSYLNLSQAYIWTTTSSTIPGRPPWPFRDGAIWWPWSLLPLKLENLNSHKIHVRYKVNIPVPWILREFDAAIFVQKSQSGTNQSLLRLKFLGTSRTSSWLKASKNSIAFFGVWALK